MLTPVFQKLSHNSQELLEFRNLLKYSFHFDYPDMKEYPKDISFIDNIFDHCNSMCNYLFHFSNNYSFFGLDSTKDPFADYTKNSIPDFTFLSFDESFWISSIKYHCVVSALYTLLFVNTKDHFITAHHLGCYIKENGYFSAIDNGYLEINGAKNNMGKRQHPDDVRTINSQSAKSTSEFSSFNKTLSRNEILAFFTNAEKIINGDTHMEFSVINMDLYFRRKLAYYNISMVKKNDLKNYYTSNETETDKRKKCDYKKYLYYAQDITKFLYKNTHDTKDVVDEILLRYKAERFYNFSLNRAMLKASVRLEKDGFPIHDESTKKCLLSFFLLPNVFSRNFFFQFAINSRKNDHLELSNFYSRKDTSSVVSVFDDQGPKIDPIRTWQDLCLKFNYFFARIIFPMYERTFFLLLIDSFNRKDGDLLKRNGKCEKLLYEYISVHAKDILEGHDTSNDSMYKNEYKRYIEYLDQTIEPTKEELKIMAETAEYILPKQDSIFNPSEPFTFTEKDLGFIAKRNYNNDINNQNKYHRELINLIINAMLSKYINMDTP